MFSSYFLRLLAIIFALCVFNFLVGCKSKPLSADSENKDIIKETSKLSFPDYYPEFSWDKVPLYYHFAKRDGLLSDEQIEKIAKRSNFFCMEKGHADRVYPKQTTMATSLDALRIKKYNPNAKVLFYWNTFLKYNLYEENKEFDKHPNWIFRSLINKEPLLKGGYLVQYNLLNPDFQQWWSDVAASAANEPGVDGIFIDAIEQAMAPRWLKLGWGEDKKPELKEAVKNMLTLARQKMGDGKIIVFNGLFNSDKRGVVGPEYLPYTDGAMVEHFTIFSSSSKEMIAADIESIKMAVEQGKITAVKGWPDDTLLWIREEAMKKPMEEKLAYAREKLPFSLACYLVAAQEQSYFSYSWGYTDKHGNIDDYAEFDKRLGPPLGPATQNGWVYKRSFKYLDVEVNIETKETVFNWK